MRYLAALVLLVGCPSDPVTSTAGALLDSCAESSECTGVLECLCGFCTTSCASSCEDFGSAVCAPAQCLADGTCTVVCANTTDCPNGTCVDGLCLTGGPGDASVEVSVTTDGGVDAASDAGPNSISSDSGPSGPDLPTDVGVDSGMHAGLDPVCVPLPMQASLEETADYRIVRGIHTFIDFGDGLPEQCGRNFGADFSLPFDFPFWGEVIPSGTTGRADGNGAIHFGDPDAFPARTRELGGAPGPGVIAAFWGADAGSTCVNSSPDQLEIYWVHGADRLIAVKAVLLPTGIIETTIYVAATGAPLVPGTLGLESRDGRSLSQPCSPSCGDAEIFPGATTRYIPVAQPMGPLVVPTCFEGPLTGRHRDEPPRFVGFTNLGDGVGTLPLGLVWSSSAGDFGRDPVAFGNFDEYWLTSSAPAVAVGATVRGLTLPYDGYAAFANTGTTHVAVSGTPDAYYVGTMVIEPYEGAVVSAPLEEHVASAGALFDVMLVGDPGAERWSWRNSGRPNPEWLTLQEHGRLYGIPPEAGVYGVSVAVHRSGMEPANHDVRITVE